VRAVLLDQVHFQDQGFQLGAHHDPFDVLDHAHQFFDLACLPGADVEVRAHPAAQVDSFAHINHLPGLLFHQVAAGFGGQRG
jgi:hypothetical protein